eukprot:321156_1
MASRKRTQSQQDSFTPLSHSILSKKSDMSDIMSKKSTATALQQPIPLCVHVIITIIIVLFYSISFGLYMQYRDGTLGTISYLDLWNISCILLYLYILLVCLLFAWECTFERINMQFHPELYDIERRKKENMKIGTIKRTINKIDLPFSEKLSAYFSMFALDWNENGIICMFTMIYSIFSSALIWYRCFTEYQVKYIWIGIRYFLGTFGLCFPEICLIYYHRGIAPYYKYLNDKVPNIMKPPSVDSSVIALKQSLFSEPFVRTAFLIEFILLFCTYQMIPAWNHDNYTQMINDIYDCTAHNCSTNLYFIINELIFRIFPGWLIGNTVMHLIMMQSGELFMMDSSSYAEIKYIITPVYLLLISFLILMDIVVDKGEACRKFHLRNVVIHENCAEFVWKYCWIVIYGLITLLLLTHLPSGFRLRNRARIIPFRGQSWHLLYGSLLIIFSTISTVFLVITDLNALNMTEWRQISSGCFNISQFMLLWVLDPVRNYMTHATETQKN